jgi:hypothetical protein
VDSLVPLLHQKLGQLDSSLSLMVEAVKNAVQGFDDTAASLVEKYAMDGDVGNEVEGVH